MSKTEETSFQQPIDFRVFEKKRDGIIFKRMVIPGLAHASRGQGILKCKLFRPSKFRTFSSSVRNLLVWLFYVREYTNSMQAPPC